MCVSNRQYCARVQPFCISPYFPFYCCRNCAPADGSGLLFSYFCFFVRRKILLRFYCNRQVSRCFFYEDYAERFRRRMRMRVCSYIFCRNAGNRKEHSLTAWNRHYAFFLRLQGLYLLCYFCFCPFRYP